MIIIGKLNVAVTYLVNYEEADHKIFKNNLQTRDQLFIDMAYKLLQQRKAEQKLKQQPGGVSRKARQQAAG